MDGSSSSSRPYTASGRPSTAAHPVASAYPPDYAGYHQQQYTSYSQEYSIDEEDEEESEAEDVFAFGPPSTADQEQRPSPTTAAPLISPSVSFPPPTFDPHAPFPSYDANTPGPSTIYTRHPYPAPTSPQVESPPSTESNPPDDPYRLRRLVNTESAPTTTTRTGTVHTGRSAVSSAVSSREVHVSLPRAKERIEEEQLDDPQKSRPPSSVTSFPSMESGVASMKCVITLIRSILPAEGLPEWSLTSTRLRRKTVLFLKFAPLCPTSTIQRCRV